MSRASRRAALKSVTLFCVLQVLCESSTAMFFRMVLLWPDASQRTVNLVGLSAKAWIKPEFDRLILADTVAPISARVISVSHFQVDRYGKILGRGHPKRDAVGWAIPVLWPLKVFTLPIRRPRPALQGEFSH